MAQIGLRNNEFNWKNKTKNILQLALHILKRQKNFRTAYQDWLIWPGIVFVRPAAEI